MSMTERELQTLENLRLGDAADEIRELRGDLAALRNDLSDALDCKNGTGPTALSLLIEERDSLRAELAASRERAIRIGEALITARDHIDMAALEISHSNDAQVIRSAVRAALAEGAQG